MLTVNCTKYENIKYDPRREITKSRRHAGPRVIYTSRKRPTRVHHKTETHRRRRPVSQYQRKTGESSTVHTHLFREAAGCRDATTGVYRITHIPICKRLSRRDLMQTQFHNPLLVQLLPVPTLARGVYSSFSDFGKRLRRRHLLPLWNAPNGSTRSVPAGSLSAPVWRRRG